MTDKNWTLLPTVRTCVNTIGQGSNIEADNDTDMQLVRLNWNERHSSCGDDNWGNGTYIKYGTKLQISSEKIVYKERHILKHLPGMETTISI